MKTIIEKGQMTRFGEFSGDLKAILEESIEAKNIHKIFREKEKSSIYPDLEKYNLHLDVNYIQPNDLLQRFSNGKILKVDLQLTKSNISTIATIFVSSKAEEEYETKIELAHQNLRDNSITREEYETKIKLVYQNLRDNLINSLVRSYKDHQNHYIIVANEE